MMSMAERLFCNSTASLLPVGPLAVLDLGPAVLWTKMTERAFLDSAFSTTPFVETSEGLRTPSLSTQASRTWFLVSRYRAMNLSPAITEKGKFRPR